MTRTPCLWHNGIKRLWDAVWRERGVWMKIRRAFVIALVLLMSVTGLAEGAGRASVVDPMQSETPTESAAPEAGDDSVESAGPTGRELSAYYGKPIAEAAGEIGGLSFEAREEFSENYFNDGLALRGNGGQVSVIELRAEDTVDTLCGIRCGMTWQETRTLMEGCPLLWEYDEELAWLIRADAQDKLRDEILVVFFDEDARVRGAWYRSGAV